MADPVVVQTSLNVLCAVIEPQQPLAASGGNLTVRCSLLTRPQPDNNSSSDGFQTNTTTSPTNDLPMMDSLRFSVGGEFEDRRRDVETLDSRTLRLTVYDVYRNMSGGKIGCYDLRGTHDAADNVTVTIAGIYYFILGTKYRVLTIL